jgi:hypothetical protein
MSAAFFLRVGNRPPWRPLPAIFKSGSQVKLGNQIYSGLSPPLPPVGQQADGAAAQEEQQAGQGHGIGPGPGLDGRVHLGFIGIVVEGDGTAVGRHGDLGPGVMAAVRRLKLETDIAGFSQEITPIGVTFVRRLKSQIARIMPILAGNRDGRAFGTRTARSA